MRRKRPTVRYHPYKGRPFKAPRRTGTFTKYSKGRKANGELKFHDLDVNDAVVAAGGNIAEDSCLTIAQGTTESSRIGRKVIVKSINWRFSIDLPSASSAGSTTEVVRVILYLDKQTNGATATVLGILETSDFQSFNNLANTSRFTTLMDRTYDLVIPTIADLAGPTTNTGEFILSDTLFKKVNIPIEYDNSFATGVITTMRSNNIGVLLLSKAGIAGFESKMRLRFSDA